MGIEIHKCDGCEFNSTHQEMGFRPFGVCTKGANFIEAEKNFRAEVCPYEKPFNFKYIELKKPEINYIFDKDVFKANFSSELMAKVVDYENKVLCDAIIKYAYEQGYTDLCLIDEKFVKSALAREIQRRKGATE